MMMQACSETLREEMFDKRIEEIKVKIKEEEAKRKSTAESNYRHATCDLQLVGFARKSNGSYSMLMLADETASTKLKKEMLKLRNVYSLTVGLRVQSSYRRQA